MYVIRGETCTLIITDARARTRASRAACVVRACVRTYIRVYMPQSTLGSPDTVGGTGSVPTRDTRGGGDDERAVREEKWIHIYGSGIHMRNFKEASRVRDTIRGGRARDSFGANSPVNLRRRMKNRGDVFAIEWRTFSSRISARYCEYCAHGGVTRSHSSRNNGAAFIRCLHCARLLELLLESVKSAVLRCTIRSDNAILSLSNFRRTNRIYFPDINSSDC